MERPFHTAPAAAFHPAGPPIPGGARFGGSPSGGAAPQAADAVDRAVALLC